MPSDEDEELCAVGEYAGEDEHLGDADFGLGGGLCRVGGGGDRK
jgi:hypothetical protein